MSKVSDIDRIIMLMEEIAYAQSQLQPQDTGHIHTAINWMKHRVDTIKKDMQYEEIQ
jgi:hypothetical protein